MTSRTAKRWLSEPVAPAASSEPSAPAELAKSVVHKSPQPGPDLPYWRSRRAKSLFGIWLPNDEDVNNHMLDVIELRDRHLKIAYIKAGGWRDIICGEKSKADLCTDTDVHWLRLKFQYVCFALEIAMEEIPRRNWQWCCHEAI